MAVMKMSKLGIGQRGVCIEVLPLPACGIMDNFCSSLSQILDPQPVDNNNICPQVGWVRSDEAC